MDERKKIAKGRGWRFRSGPIPKSLLERASDKFTVGDGCWEWNVAGTAGYGRIRSGASSLLAHRVIYELLVGPIPEGKQLDHLCRNRVCVRPDHLEPVTCRENLRRGTNQVADAMDRDSCVHGHPYDEANTYLRLDGRGRECRACRREASAKFKKVGV